jgi:ADP-heptose:LPS heptosyltransferase
MLNFFTGGNVPFVPQRVAIAEHGNLGDVIACLPMAGTLKQAFPGVRIHFVARRYAKPLLDACAHVDGFVDSERVLAEPQCLRGYGFDAFLNPFPWRELGRAAFRARLPRRIAHLDRGSNVLWCSRFVWCGPSARELHTAQRNLRDLRAFGLRPPVQADLSPLMALTRLPSLAPHLAQLLDPQRFNLILHPKSRGHGREWPIEHYLALCARLPADRFRLLLTGCDTEHEWIAAQCPALLRQPGLADLTGRLELGELIALIAAADGLLASGTGPLHLAGALGIHALGLFPAQSGIDPVRWRPMGARAEYLCASVSCSEPCRSCGGGACECMRTIRPEQVAARLLAWTGASTPRAIQLA